MRQNTTSHLVALAAVITTALTVRTAQAADYVIHDFKTPRKLTLDPSRVAVRGATPQLGEVAAAVAALGLDPASLAPSEFPGWSYVGLPAGASRGMLEEVVDRLAGESAVSFVSPVFVGLDGGPVIVTPEILVQFDRTTPRVDALAKVSGLGRVLDEDWAGMQGAYRVASPLRDGPGVLEAANALAVSGGTIFAEPDMMFTGHGTLIPNDPGWGNLWGLHNTAQFGGIADMDMDAPEAWDTTLGSASIRVLIIDTGVDQAHADIRQIPGGDMSGETTDGAPFNSCDNHGTPVAGCVSAIANNALGTCGSAPGVTSVSARTFRSVVGSPCSGNWTTNSSWTVNALALGESLGVRVTNNSNFYGFTSSAIATKYATTRAAGMVHFACTGNDNASAVAYPSSLPDVLAIGSVSPSGTRSSFSNYGTGIFGSAAGQSVYTTDRTGAAGYVASDYGFFQGTSFATPYAAGIGALVLSKNPGLSAADVESALSSGAVNLGPAGYDTEFGHGFLNARNALDLVPAPARVERWELH